MRDCGHLRRRTRRHYATPTEGGYDLAILNAYPKNLDITQSMMALNVSFYGNESIVCKDGTVPPLRSMAPCCIIWAAKKWPATSPRVAM